MDDNKENLIESPDDNDMPSNQEVTEAIKDTETEDEPKITFETEGSTIFVKHEYKTKKPVKRGWVKRLGYCALAIFVCLAIAAASMLVVKFVEKPSNETVSVEAPSATAATDVLTNENNLLKNELETVTEDGEQISLLKSTNIEGAGIFNYYEEYSIMPYTEKITVNGEETECIKWYIQGLKPEVTLSDKLYEHIVKCMTVKASAVMENTYDSVEEYHLAFGIDYEKPTRAFYITFTDGNEPIEILVGRQTPDRDANYLTVRGIGDDTVYIVSASYIMNYDYLPTDFADLEMLEPLKHTTDNDSYYTKDVLSRFDYIKLSGGAVGDREIEFGMSSGASADYIPYEMITPYKRPADDQFLKNIINIAANGLTADELFSFKATDENKEKCGFDDPSCVMEVKIGDYRFKLIIGGLMEKDSTRLSAMIEGKDQIFGVSAEGFDFITPEITQMFDSDFIIENIYSVKGVTMKFKGVGHKYELIHTPRDGASNVFDTTVNYNGTKVHTDSFKALYQRVLLLSLMKFVTEVEKGEVVFSVTFEYIEDYPNKVVEFTAIKDDPYHYIAWVDGVPLGEVLKTSVDDVTDNLKNYVNGGTIAYPL